MISHQKPHRLPSFQNTLQTLLQKQQHINTSLEKLRECKNISFTKLKQELSQKDNQILQLRMEKQQMRIKMKQMCKQKEQASSRFKKVVDENDELKFKLDREARKCLKLKEEIKDVTERHRDTERKYREQMRRLEEDLMWTKLKGTDIHTKRRGSLTNKVAVNLSKAFEDQTQLSFNQQSFSRK